MNSAPVPPPVPGAYDATSITVLPGLEAVRQSPAMYIGSTDQEGLHQLVYELVDNAIDESMMGFCSTIRVVFGADGSCLVEDDGRGIPTDLHPSEGIPACELVLTRLHSGGKFGTGTYFRTAGIHGVGLSCVNALAERLLLEVWRDGVYWRQPYERGVAMGPVERVGPTDRRGTRITFVPDPTVFDANLRFDHDTIARHLEELAFLHPGLLVHVDDHRTGRSASFQYESGILGFVDRLNRDRTILHPRPVHIRHHDASFDLELAMQWTAEYGECLYSYVNSIHTVYGGTHVSGLKTALGRVVNTWARDARMVNAESGERITTFDILEGLTCVLSVQMTNPRFESQTKTRLTSRETREAVERVVTVELARIFQRDPALAQRVVTRALDASRARQAARRASDRARYQVADVRVSDEVYQKQFGIRSKNWHKSAVWLTDDQLLSMHADMLHQPPGARLLDVCCGSGVVGAAFKGKVAESIGLDLTPEMVQLARTRLDTVHQGTVYELPFPDASFDVVCTREVLHILAMPQKPVAEIFRVLKPGGQFIVGQILPYSELDGPWMYRVFKKKQPLIFNMFQEEDFRALLVGGGFVDIEMREYYLWESIDVWIDTHETTNLHRHEIRELFYNAPQEARSVHPFKILPSGEILDQWRWCVYSAVKPG